MKFGINTFVWVSPCTTEAVRELAPKVKAFGFDILEISVENPALLDPEKIKKILNENSLDGIFCGAFGSDRNLANADEKLRNNAKEYVRWLIDASDIIGSKVVCGPFYSSVGKEHPESQTEQRAEWERAVSGARELADYASSKGINLAFEPLNRFETDMINIVAQGLKFISDINRENVGFHLDTFHMHLEEKDSAKAIRQAGKHLFHFHACENDRGVPGTGQVRWNEIAAALKEIGYRGPVVIESFTSQVKEIAKAVCIWREIAPSQDAIAQQGLHFLKTLWA